MGIIFLLFTFYFLLFTFYFLTSVPFSPKPLPTTSEVVKFRDRALKQQLNSVAYVPQRSQIDWDYPITVWNVVLMARTVHTGWFRTPSRPSQEIVKDALVRVGMLELRSRQIGELSGGQQQRVFLARALAQQAELLFFDEPFVGVDKKTEAIMFEVFEELKSQLSFFTKKELLFYTFDPLGAQASGLPINLIHFGLTGAITLTIIASMQAVGVVFVVSLLIGPGITAYLLVKELQQMMLLGAVIGVISSMTRMYISYYLNVPSGAAIVLVVSVLFLLALFLSPSQGILTRPEMAHQNDLRNKHPRLATSFYRHQIASVRTNTVTVKLAEILAKRDSRSLTIAVESSPENLRRIINKKLHNDEIIQAAINAKGGGLTNLKLYGMVGIPGEEPEDLEQTVAMMRSLKKTVPSLRLTFGCSTFVPKAHTPFQWFGVNRQAEKRLQLLQKQLKPQGIEFRPESYNWSIIQALLSRGDRRLSHLLEFTRNYGDSLGSYRRAFKQLKGQIPNLDFYVHDNWSTDIVLPWNHLQGPLPQSILIKHLADATSYFNLPLGESFI